MQHLDEGTIHSWLDGALSADEATRVEAHVAECPQCATAVAEARGFIAASSRILTALDHVPRGVVPAAHPIKWYNRPTWRAAAAVLVVAVGTLAVVRNGRNETADRREHLMVDSTSGKGNPQSAAPIIIAATPATTTTRKPNVPASVTASSGSSLSAEVASPGKPVAQADFSDKSVGGAAQSNITTRERARDEAVGTAIGGNAAAAPPVAGAVIAVLQPALSSRVPGTAMLQAAAAEEPPLKVVGTPRMIGAKVTLYEVAPGDTVTFTEASNVQLEAVVVTGTATMEPQARRSTAKSAATAPTSAASPSPAAPPLRVDVTTGVTTISWPDASTGNMLSLSGRMSAERLKEIKLRIERERTAARKNP